MAWLGDVVVVGQADRSLNLQYFFFVFLTTNQPLSSSDPLALALALPTLCPWPYQHKVTIMTLNDVIAGHQDLPCPFPARHPCPVDHRT